VQSAGRVSRNDNWRRDLDEKNSEEKSFDLNGSGGNDRGRMEQQNHRDRCRQKKYGRKIASASPAAKAR
jgi:hypothetical protein